MAVPETSMSEQHGIAAFENEVWATGKLAIMQAEPIAAGVQAFAKKQLWFGVVSPDAGHHPAAYFREYYISH